MLFRICNRRQKAEARRTIGIVFQDFRLIQSMTIAENLEFSMRCIGAQVQDIEQRIPEVLDLVSMREKKDCFPTELSGGEQQRAAIARAIINRPETILADEPTGNLDPILAQEIMALFIKLNETCGTTTVVITHARELVEQSAMRVITLSAGKIVSDCRGHYLDSEEVCRL